MTDWKLISAARGLAIPEPEMDRLAPLLDALEAAFRPLAASLPLTAEPAFRFEAAPEAGDDAR